MEFSTPPRFGKLEHGRRFEEMYEGTFEVEQVMCPECEKNRCQDDRCVLCSGTGYVAKEKSGEKP